MFYKSNWQIKETLEPLSSINKSKFKINKQHKEVTNQTGQVTKLRLVYCLFVKYILRKYKKKVYLDSNF